MIKRYLPRRSRAVWVAGLLLVGLTLAACGGASDPVSEEPTSPAGTEETANRSADVEEAAQDQEVAATEEATPTEEAEEVAPQENLLAPGSTIGATCQSVGIPDNELIAAVSDSDWVKGPADAPVTLIEYGDFQ